MPQIEVCELSDVRGGEPGFPVSIVRDLDDNRLYIRGVNEGGYSCVDIDLRDLAAWFGVDADTVESSLIQREP